MSTVSVQAVEEYGLDYNGGEIPQHYKCYDCGATGCKLWTHRFREGLYCFHCADAKEGDNAGEGFRQGKSHWIGELCPATPVKVGDEWTSWGALHIPDEAVGWWEELPDYRNSEGNA